MTDEFSTTLSWFAGYSNFYSVISVLICFCIMVVFILRLNGDHFLSSSATHYNTPKEQPMTQLHNPFSIQLSGGKITSIKDGLYLDVCMKTSARTEIFWGVNIQIFQKEIQQPFTDIYRKLIEKETFDGNYLHKGSLGIIEATDRPCEFYSKTPETVTESGLGSPPRQLYPVVVVSVVNNKDLSDVNHSVVSQFTIIHLKDSMCPLDSHIVYQFVKTNQNNLLSLQPIFLSSSEHDFSGTNTTTEESVSSPTNTNADNCVQCCMLKRSDVTTIRSSCPVCSCKSVEDPTKLKCSGNEILEESVRNESTNDTDEQNDDHLEDIGTNEGINYDERLDAQDNDFTGLDETNTCIICQNAVIYYTLLPCRHACVCMACVGLVDKCPMCRSYIDAFFRLYDRDYSRESSVSETESQNDVHVPAASIWEAITQRLNEMFGFA